MPLLHCAQNFVKSVQENLGMLWLENQSRAESDCGRAATTAIDAFLVSQVGQDLITPSEINYS